MLGHLLPNLASRCRGAQRSLQPLGWGRILPPLHTNGELVLLCNLPAGRWGRTGTVGATHMGTGLGAAIASRSTEPARSGMAPSTGQAVGAGLGENSWEMLSPEPVARLIPTWQRLACSWPFPHPNHECLGHCHPQEPFNSPSPLSHYGPVQRLGEPRASSQPWTDITSTSRF